MKILFTGASSFTGSWFAQTLARAGHSVVATYRGLEDSYVGTRGDRVKRLQGLVERVWGVEFGDDAFFNALSGRSFDLVCHHAAEMQDYRSWDFDALDASRKNTRGARHLLADLAAKGGGRLIVTGSVFEPYEGLGDKGQRAFSPYGLSKHLSFEVLRLEAERLGVSLGKFVIPNPFGPQEEMRFTSYLAKEWATSNVPSVGTPAYIRDNIHVSLLALAYRRHCEALTQEPGLSTAHPSGYIESQGSFARRVGREIGSRIGRACPVTEADQREFPEPLIRINDQPAAQAHPEWSESEAWDDLSSFYAARFGLRA